MWYGNEDRELDDADDEEEKEDEDMDEEEEEDGLMADQVQFQLIDSRPLSHLEAFIQVVDSSLGLLVDWGAKNW